MVLEQYCGDESVPVLDAIERILLVLEKQFTENIRCYKEKLKDEQFRQNFEVLRLPIFRNEAKLVEKLIVRGNAEGGFTDRESEDAGAQFCVCHVWSGGSIGFGTGCDPKRTMGDCGGSVTD